MGLDQTRRGIRRATWVRTAQTSGADYDVASDRSRPFRGRQLRSGWRISTPLAAQKRGSSRPHLIPIGSSGLWSNIPSSRVNQAFRAIWLYSPQRNGSGALWIGTLNSTPAVARPHRVRCARPSDLGGDGRERRSPIRSLLSILSLHPPGRETRRLSLEFACPRFRFSLHEVRRAVVSSVGHVQRPPTPASAGAARASPRRHTPCAVRAR